MEKSRSTEKDWHLFEMAVSVYGIYRVVIVSCLMFIIDFAFRLMVFFCLCFYFYIHSYQYQMHIILFYVLLSVLTIRINFRCKCILEYWQEKLISLENGNLHEYKMWGTKLQRIKKKSSARKPKLFWCYP